MSDVVRAPRLRVLVAAVLLTALLVAGCLTWLLGQPSSHDGRTEPLDGLRRPPAVQPPPGPPSPTLRPQPPAEFAERLARELDATLVHCDAETSLPDGAVLEIVHDLPREFQLTFPRTVPSTPLHDGHFSFLAPAWHPGSATWTLEGAESGLVTWPGQDVATPVDCSSMRSEHQITGVHGRVVDQNGEASPRSSILGCGGWGYAEDDGTFFLLVHADEPCDLRVVRGAEAARREGTPIRIHPSPDKDLTGIVLQAPERPEPRPHSEAEHARGRTEMCEFWAGQHYYTLALARAGSHDETEGAEAKQAERIQTLERRYQEILTEFCLPNNP